MEGFITVVDILSTVGYHDKCGGTECLPHMYHDIFHSTYHEKFGALSILHGFQDNLLSIDRVRRVLIVRASGMESVGVYECWKNMMNVKKYDGHHRWTKFHCCICLFYGSGLNLSIFQYVWILLYYPSCITF